jgi:hypothetical protein
MRVAPWETAVPRRASLASTDVVYGGSWVLLGILTRLGVSAL